jgi:hypothetical protein
VRALDATVQLRNLTTGAGPVLAGSLTRVALLSAPRGRRRRKPWSTLWRSRSAGSTSRSSRSSRL